MSCVCKLLSMDRFIQFAPKHIYKEEYKEFVCDHDDNILERYLADSEIPPTDYWNTIIALVAKAKVYPVLHGSAMFNIGINELMDAITSFILPPASVSDRLSAYLYKIEHDPKGHKRSFLKIIDGSLRLRDVVRINDSEKSIKIKNLKTIYQGREINVDEVGANSISQVSFAHTGWSIQKQRVECFCRIFSYSFSYCT